MLLRIHSQLVLEPFLLQLLVILVVSTFSSFQRFIDAILFRLAISLHLFHAFPRLLGALLPPLHYCRFLRLQLALQILHRLPRHHQRILRVRRDILVVLLQPFDPLSQKTQHLLLLLALLALDFFQAFPLLFKHTRQRSIRGFASRVFLLTFFRLIFLHLEFDRVFFPPAFRFRFVRFFQPLSERFDLFFHLHPPRVLGGSRSSLGDCGVV